MLAFCNIVTGTKELHENWKLKRLSYEGRGERKGNNITSNCSSSITGDNCRNYTLQPWLRVYLVEYHLPEQWISVIYQSREAHEGVCKHMREKLSIKQVHFTFNLCPNNQIPPKLISGAFISLRRWILFWRIMKQFVILSKKPIIQHLILFNKKFLPLNTFIIFLSVDYNQLLFPLNNPTFPVSGST